MKESTIFSKTQRKKSKSSRSSLQKKINGFETSTKKALITRKGDGRLKTTFRKRNELKLRPVRSKQLRRQTLTISNSKRINSKTSEKISVSVIFKLFR